MCRHSARERQELREPFVEREPHAFPEPGLRPRVEAGAALLSALDDANLSIHRNAFVWNCPIDIDPSHHPDGCPRCARSRVTAPREFVGRFTNGGIRRVQPRG